ICRPEESAVSTHQNTRCCQAAGSCCECVLVEVCVRGVAWVGDVNRSHEIWHVGGGATGKRGISLAQRYWRCRRRIKLRAQARRIAITHLDRESRSEAGNALDLPSFHEPWPAVREPLERQLP